MNVADDRYISGTREDEVNTSGAAGGLVATAYSTG